MLALNAALGDRDLLAMAARKTDHPYADFPLEDVRQTPGAAVWPPGKGRVYRAERVFACGQTEHDPIL
ncbi:MAG: hypothetical protein ACE5GK_05250 [Nitrospiria bacterium]